MIASIESIFISNVYIFICYLWSFLIAKSDFEKNKIPNNIILFGIGIYIFSSVSVYFFFEIHLDAGETGRSSALWAFRPLADTAAGALLLAIGFTLWMLRLLGAGDAKMLFPIGLILGFDYLSIFSLILLILGAATYAIVRIPYPRSSGGSRFIERLMEIRSTGRIPYGVLLAIAFALALGRRYLAETGVY
ncbi:prepilin peptidase [Oricola cellulosilytica]|nr:prepilin peptidase [Oricola cellulosilytica]